MSTKLVLRPPCIITIYYMRDTFANRNAWLIYVLRRMETYLLVLDVTLKQLLAKNRKATTNGLSGYNI